MTQTCAGAVVNSHKNIVSDFRFLAEPATRQEKIDSMIRRAARQIGLGYSRAYEIWYGRAKVSVEERDAIAAAARAKRTKEARNELHELKLRLARLEAGLNQVDADFHSETIDRLRSTLREPR